MPCTCTQVRFVENQPPNTHQRSGANQAGSKASRWYTPEEIKAFREASKSDESNLRHISRGYARRQNHAQSILDLQQEHRDHAVEDAKGLATLSLALSKESKKEAQQQAAKDSFEVFEVHAKNTLCPTNAATAEEYAKQTRPRRSLTRRSRFPSCA